jgi:predicted DsbA family dithiol-disulfide isomerase
MDRKLRLEFKDDLSIAYYNYPLDTVCNPYVNETSHPFSCVASKAVIASGDLNVFASYLEKLLEATNESTDDFSKQTALKISDGLSDVTNFAKRMDLAATSDLLRRDIDLAEKLKIRVTPTIFIDGRRVDGVPPQQVMEAAIRRELADKCQRSLKTGEQ